MLLGSSSGFEKTFLQYVAAFAPLLFNDRLNLGGVDGSGASSGIKKLWLVQIQPSLIMTESYYPGFGICVEQLCVPDQFLANSPTYLGSREAIEKMDLEINATCLS